jgi:hypothetical protein
MAWRLRMEAYAPRYIQGTLKQFKEWSPEVLTAKVRERAREASCSPERAAKVAETKRGKPRPAHVIEALRKANVGRRPSAEHRAKTSEAHRVRGTYPPAAGRAFTPAEDNLLGTATDRELAERWGRHPTSVWKRRKYLGVRSYRSTEGAMR